MLKKFLWMLLLVGLLVPVLPVHAQFESFQAVVKRSYIVVRDAPEGEIIGELEWGTVVEVIDQSKLWWHIRTPEIEGWAWSGNLRKMPFTVKVSAGSLNLRAEPNTDAAILAEIPQGTELLLIGKDDISGNGGIWAQVRYGDLVGWVSAEYLDCFFCVWQRSTPVTVHDERTLDTPITAQGVITGVILIGTEVYREVRLTPNWGSEVIGVMDGGSGLAIYGQYGKHWIYVRQINGTLQGWLPLHRIFLPADYPISDLPVLEPVATPTLTAPEIQPTDALNAIVIGYYGGPVVLDAGDDWDSAVGHLDRNASITLIGRNARSTYYLFYYEGERRWIPYEFVHVDGDPYRLPIYSLKSYH